ncbi:FGGY carbohydrate kinase domain-containing protein isoform X2 [Lycorma delicatula]|uniref:FGGY carbohydrate kinase domain-containing protein isoform X2 n=1 Tax=Lycorma delicatula TaxID=130591 RepID=UPI003F518334
MGETKEEYFIGVDVGTSSTRAALVNLEGKIIKVAVNPIKTWNPQSNFFQQSSEDIWNSCCTVIKEVTNSIEKNLVQGITFDATCSLVAVDKNGNPVSVSPGGEVEQNIILWLDHRAEYEANEINKTGHNLLHYVGGKISLEMELPKLLWLKRNLKQQCWNKTYYFFDLADFLSWKATGCDSRSLCTVICKWLYDAVGFHWDKKFFSNIGLEDLLVDGSYKIGKIVKAPGAPCGNGLTVSAADQMGLLPGTCVSTSIIDAHAGVLGLIGAKNPNLPTELDTRLSLICGTSTCHMALSKDALFVSGVWGPYYSVLGMGFWLNEGGQSATGKLLDHIIDIHPAAAAIHQALPKEMHIFEYLNNLLYKMSENKGLLSCDMLTQNIHVWPDFHGNRSPVADPTLHGMMSGLSLSTGEEDLALKYLATVQALALSQCFKSTWKI